MLNPPTETQISFMVGLRCNFKCSYCFSRILTGNNKDFEWNTQTVYNIRDCYKDDSTLELVYFGGEPLLYWNKILECEEIFKDVKFQRRIVSNCSLLKPEMIDVINNDHINFFLSHDGKYTYRTRGRDVLRDHKIVRLLNKIENLGVSCVITNLNTNIWENYLFFRKYFPNHKPNFGFTPIQVFDENYFLAKDFNFDEYVKSYAYYHYKTNQSFHQLPTKGGIQILPNGDLWNTATMNSIGYFDSNGLHIDNEKRLKDMEESQCNLKDCKWWYNGCVYKTLQVRNHNFCYKMGEARSKIPYYIQRLKEGVPYESL